jgi:hypothetical protein
MAKSLSSPWIYDLLKTLLVPTLSIDATNADLTQFPRVNLTPKTVQILQTKSNSHRLTITDLKHSIDVYFSEECFIKLQGRKLKYMLIKLKTYHVTTTIVASGDRTDVTESSYPLAIQCNDVQFLGGHDLENLAVSGISINRDPSFTQFFNGCQYDNIVSTLAVKQFGVPFLPSSGKVNVLFLSIDIKCFFLNLFRWTYLHRDPFIGYSLASNIKSFTSR